MKLGGIIPSTKDFEAVDNLEAELLRRRRTGTIGGLIGLIGIVAQAVQLAREQDYPQKIGNLLTGLYQLQFKELIGPQGMPVPEFIGLLALVVGFGIYFTLRWTSFLTREAEEPFQYTFWIEPFADAGSPAVKAPPSRILLLHHDLMERLNNRIKRLTLLDENVPAAASKIGAPATSHIHISGHYAVRELEDKKWVIHAMPRIRIGPPGNSATLAQPIKYPLGETALSADNYNQMIERVYSSVATEVYKQIENDVKGKMSLFPTPYLRAVAYFHEAEDFAKSNTIDAYYHAIELYREALGHFDITNIKWFIRFILSLPLLWRLKVKSEHLRASVQIGYAKCLIFRRQISALTGRTTEPLYEIRDALNEVIPNLERLNRMIGGFEEQKRSKVFISFLTFPRDSLLRILTLRPLQRLFLRQRRILFDAYVVDALAHYELNSFKKAEDDLRDARAVEPQLSEKNPLYLLAAAEIEPDLTKATLLFRQATEIDPNFQTAQYSLARSAQMLFRAQGELLEGRAKSVLEEYDRVLKINPGNIAALAAQGYLYWLVADPTDKRRKEGNLSRAKKKFEEGCEIKAIVSETFTGELNYGLARIAAEEGRFNTSYDLFKLALESDPGIGAWSVSATTRPLTSYYEFITAGMLGRYEKYLATVKAYANGTHQLDARDGHVTDRVRKAVESFAQNDYGNACLNYYSRLGSNKRKEEALEAFTEATRTTSENIVAKYNLDTAYTWTPEREPEADTIAALTEITERIPTWRAAMIALTQAQAKEPGLGKLREQIKTTRANLMRGQQEAQQTNKASKDLKEKLELRRNRTESSAAIQNQLPSQFPAAAISLKQGVTQDDLQGMIKEIEDLDSQTDQHKERAAQLRGDLEKLEEELSKQARDALVKMAENTKLSALFEELKPDYNGKGVDELLANRFLRWGRLDENDVQALRAWAEILSSNEESRNALEASIKICDHIIAKYYPASFEVGIVLTDALSRLSELAERPGSKSRLQRARAAIKAFIARWLENVSRVLQRVRKRLLESRELKDLEPNREPGNFDIRLRIVRRLTKLDLALNRTRTRLLMLPFSTKKKQVDETIKLTVDRWIKGDPIHYFSLSWHALHFSHPQHKEVVGRAVKIAGEDNEYLISLFGDYEVKMGEFLMQSDYPSATLQYEIAKEIAPRTPDCYLRLASDWEGFEAPGFRSKALENAVEALELAEVVARANGLQPIPDAIQQKVKLSADETMVGHFGEQALAREFGPLSILVTVGAHLSPYAEGAGYLGQDVSVDIFETMGVVLPPIGFRVGNLLDGSYTFLINDTGVERGTVRDINGAVFPRPSKSLEVLGILGVQTTNPQTGGDAVWVSQKDAKKLRDAGYRLWDAGEYLMRHLSAVLHGKLAEFVGHDEVLEMLETNPGLAAEHQQLRLDPRGLTLLTMTLRHLLNEQVPIREFVTIVQTFITLKEAGENLRSIVEAIRVLPSVRPALWGNNDSWSFYSLDRALEDEIHGALRGVGSARILAMAQTKHVAIVGAVRSAVSGKQRAALLVDRAELRPFIRNLIELEFPRTPVLSRNELHPGLNGRIVGEIRLEVTT